jgi:hypothetical protein
MKKIYIPTEGKEDWRKFLADPITQWREGYSAYELANCWEHADGFPKCINNLFHDSVYPLFNNFKLLLAIPEYKVDLPGGIKSSQNDLFALCKNEKELCSIMIEAKVSEHFGDHTVRSWLENASEGKIKRLDYLKSVLNLTNLNIDNIRYQLLHRTASAIIEAKNFTANNALMLVQTFSKSDEHFDDFSLFLEIFGINNTTTNNIYHAGLINNINLYLGWVNCSF